jgi:hypothetical protein
MRATNQDRLITPLGKKRSSWATAAALLAVTAGVGGILWHYSQSADQSQRQQLATLQNAVEEFILPDAPTGAGPEPASAIMDVAPNEAADTEPSLAPAPHEAALPLLDASDTLALEQLLGVSRPGMGDFVLADQLLRRFVTAVNNTAAGKVDHKSGPFLPIKPGFSASQSVPITMTADSQARYQPYVSMLTTIKIEPCVTLYRRFYPLLSTAYAELGEAGTFHSTTLKAIDMLLATPDLSQPPALIPAEKGLYRFAEPQLEALPAAQKQLLRTGWENVSALKIWLRQLRKALLSQPAAH